MHGARAFSFVCAGLFMLVLSAEFRATGAQGQATGAGWFTAGTDIGGTPYVLTASGDWWRYLPGYGWLSDLGNIFGATSGGRTIVSVLPGEVVTSTGEVWYGGLGARPWTNAGVPPLGATPVGQPSWGQVKARYAK